MKTAIHLGTQGWNYSDWAGVFYPDGARPADYLSIYARAFGTVEVDSTFYAVPPVATLRGWYERTPSNFIFALKFPQVVSHEARLRDVDGTTDLFFDRARELREKLLKLEADTQAKIAEIRKQSFEKRLADIEQDGQEQQTILEGQLAQGLTTEVEYAQNRYNQSLQSLDTQLALVRKRRSQISATDIEGQEALAAQEAGLQKKRQDALSQFLEAQLSLIDRENKAATEVLEQSELDRKLIVKQASLTGLANKDASADAEIKATQRRIIQEIALEEQKNATLRSLSAFSDPAKEADRQSRIRASVKKTTELRLQLLDEERKAFDTLIDRQIKGIQNQARERELASDVEVRAIEFQSKQYDLLSRSLETQNKLLQSRGTLANALNGFIQGEYKILQDTAESESEKKRLIQEAANAQLVALKQQQVVAQKNLEIEIKQAEIAQKRAEFEAQIAENKAKVGAMKAEADVLKAESTLQKVQRDPNASEADVAAAKLDVTAARAAAAVAVPARALATQPSTFRWRPRATPIWPGPTS